MSLTYRALTWDHPRGYNALAAAAARLDPSRDGLSIQWDKQPLEGFESHPIDDLCAHYDIVVLDHPHIGEAVAKGCLQPLEDIFGPEVVRSMAAASIGPSLASYRYQGRHWALPLDAATQVMATRPDLLNAPAPATWDAVVELPETVPLCLSMAGPHAILTFFSICAALGEPVASVDPDRLVSRQTGLAALAILRALEARSLPAARTLNPIGILNLMASADSLAICPLVFGYVTYAAPADSWHMAIRFENAPRSALGGRPGTTLGGTGIGLSTRCRVAPELIAHLSWLMSSAAQVDFIPTHDGQPSRRDAWQSSAVNRRWGDFYRNTFDTLEQAWVRPRHNGYIPFQGAASAILRSALVDLTPDAALLDQLEAIYAKTKAPGDEI